MKIRGYIKELMPNSFSIPIYKLEGKYYYHVLDDNFRITDFNQAEIDKNTFIDWYSDKNYEVGDIGAVVFIGKNYIKCGDAVSSVNEIVNYLEETTESGTYKNIKKEALYLRDIVIVQLQEEAAKEAFSNIQENARYVPLVCDFVQPRLSGSARWYMGRISEEDDQIYHIPHIAVKGEDGQRLFSRIFDEGNAAKIDADPIQIEIVAQLFEDYLNSNLALSGAKVFNKPFLNKFSRILEIQQSLNTGVPNLKTLYSTLYNTSDILNVHHHSLPYWHSIIINSKPDPKVDEEAESNFARSKLVENGSYKKSTSSQKQARSRK